MKQYNILWIFSDQHRGQAMGVAGDPNAETPHMDALAEDGILFRNTYSVSPLCSPARACYYTGKYIHEHGVGSLHVPPRHDLKMLPEMLQAQGYDTTHIGKWHLSGGAAPSHFVSPYFRPGWDTWIGWENSNRPFATTYSVDTRPTLYTINGYQTDGATDFAVDCVRKLGQQQKPWFLVLSVEPPHGPNIAPEEDMEAFRDKEIQFRDNVPDSWKTEENINHLRAYYAQIRNLDRNMGRLLDTLKETGQYDNTIIMYFSDHGDFKGSHGLDQKILPEEESSRIPLIIRHPDMKRRGIICDEIVSSMDVTKTTLAMANCPADPEIHGADLSEIVLNGEGTTQGWALIEMNSFLCNDKTDRFYRAIVDRDYLYSEGKEPQNHKLYDMRKDPGQMNNVVNEPAYQDAAKCMHERLMKVLRKIGDPIYKEWE